MGVFRFAHPYVLALLLMPILFFILPRLRHRFFSSHTTLIYSDIRLMANLPTTWRVRFMRAPDILRLGAWIVLVVALARPQAGNARDVIQGQGIDIVLALDISNSMAALDFEPQNRLQAAKSVIGDFILSRTFDRVGLVVFARNAYHQVPLTLDYDTFSILLDDVQLVEDIVDVNGVPLLLDGTAIGLGIASAANMLRGSENATRVIILLTDGDNNAALDPLQASTAAHTLGIRIYTVGVGRQGDVRIPDRSTGEIVTVQSDLDEASLQEIARIGDGRYFRAEDLADLQAIYDQIDILERTDIERVVVVRWRDQGFGLLFISLALLLIERGLRMTVFQSHP